MLFFVNQFIIIVYIIGTIMKKVLSALFSLFVIASIGVLAYFNQQFIMHQVDKLKGMYFVEKGDQAYKDLKMNDAIRFYSKGLSLFPEHYGAWYNLGNIYVVYEDYQSAMYAYSQAYKYNPKFMIARINYGIVASEKMGNFDSAIEQYDNVINTKRKLISIPYVFDNKLSYKENRAIAYYNKGVTYKLKALYTDDKVLKRIYISKAINAYENAVKIDNNNYDALFNLALAYHSYGDYRRAGKCYCKAINLEPMNYEPHYNLAVLLRRLGHYEDAYEEIDKAITLITALDENSSVQEYVASVMNDITRSVYTNYERRKKLQAILEQEKRKLAQKDEKSRQKWAKDKEKEKKQKNKKGINDDFIFAPGVKIIDGKVVEPEDMDNAMVETFGKCPSIRFFDPSQKEFMQSYE